jgi:ribosomal protein L31E
VCEKQHDRTKTLREKERISSKREMIQFLHDGMRTSSLDVRIKEVAASRLWNRGIDSISAVVYLQQSNSRRLTVYEIQHKGLGTPDVIEDA